MVKDDREKEKGIGKASGERKILSSLIKNCAAELKLLITALLLLCSLATLVQLLPVSVFPYSYSSDLPPCITPPTAALTTAVADVENSSTTATASATTYPSPPLEEILDTGVVKRSFHPAGTAAYNFILMSAYRGGVNSFVIMGLSSKPLHVFSRPIYTCEYESNDGSIVSVPGRKILPDWGYGRVYTTVVINCTFPLDSSSAVVDPTTAGRLVLHATVNGGFDTNLNMTDTILALEEAPNSWNVSQYVTPSPKYDYLYCGSSLYGGLSPQRVREWIAYHVKLFGERSHFVIQDAGGVHPEVFEVLKPWIELGYVTVHDIRDQERFDGYYHNQFLVVNDCLHRYRFDTKWMFFFDVDEFIHLNPKYSFGKLMDSLEEYTQFTIEQLPMSNQLCLIQDAGKTSKKWGFEKLVYRNIKRVPRRDRKYAVQPQNVYATGVHLSQNFNGKSTHTTSSLMRYFHYHGTIAQRREPCQQLVNQTYVKLEDTPFVQDTSMRSFGPLVKNFELQTIGNVLQSTRQ